MIEYEISERQEKVLDVMCDAITITSTTGKSTYYFNAAYKVDPALYQGHKFGNWYFFLEKSRALPLKTVVETAQFKLISVATEVKSIELDDDFFALPEGTLMKASPY